MGTQYKHPISLALHPALYSALALLIALSLVLSSCKKSSSTSTSDAKKFRVGLVLGAGGVDDKSFNSSAFLGATRAQKELGIELRYVEVSNDTETEPMHRSFAEKNFDLIIGVGFAQQEAVEHAAKAFPKTHFILVDAIVNAPNVESLMFNEQEGSYLAGALAAMKSKSGVIGFIGGMDIPLIRRFELGYQEGAKHENPKIKVISNYVGVTGEAWNNPTKSKELALNQMEHNVDVIFHAAGQSGLGVFDAVEEVSKKTGAKVYAIGVDSNQNWVKPGYILTSMLKRIDNAVFDTIKEAKNGNFRAGSKFFGLNNSGIDLAMDSNNKALIEQSFLTEIEKLKKEIIESKITVSDYYKIHKN